MTLLGILILCALVLLTSSLQRTYGSVPIPELKRRARTGDPIADRLFKAAAYGSSLRALLWSLIIGFTSLLFIVVSKETASWFALTIIGGILWLGFVWLPAREATAAGIWMAQKTAPVFAKILQYINPYLIRVIEFVHRHHPVHFHTGLYDRTDLEQLFARQKVQADNRIDLQTLEIVEHALQFGSKTVAQILTPRRVVKAVSSADTTGPLLMDDLHKSGHSRFPVFGDTQDSIVGILYLRNLVKAKAGGTVQKTMTKQVCYVHEDQPLTEALQAILKTHQQLFIVVNSFEEYVGIVTIEDIMEAIVGQQIVDEFDEYEDLRAVAAKLAHAEHTDLATNQPTHKTIDEVIEI